VTAPLRRSRFFCLFSLKRISSLPLNNLPISRRIYSRSLGWLIGAMICVTAAIIGCGKNSISKDELRAITTEVVNAAQSVTGHGAEIKIRPMAAPGQAGIPAAPGFEDIYISLSDPKQAPGLKVALEQIAQRHALSFAASSSGGVARYDFSFHGARTHSIHVVTPLSTKTARREPIKPLHRQAKGGPQLAIIIDDIGNDRAAADSVLALNFPVTLSVLPHLPLSAEIAEEAHRRGDQVMLHMPMQSEGEDAKPEYAELRVGMRAGEVNELLTSALDSVPHVVGVNNHQGSLATSNSALMAELMPALRQRGLFFIDSRTEKTTVAYDAAKKAGVRAASRRVFLDDVATREAVIAQLRLAAKDAQRDGSAIAIGHPKPATIAALEEEGPRLAASGIDFVFASDLVQ
jgi:polysaccharide deacetylase 2 family uncharacterized protein YibQ